jgi:hypothetical protein
MGRTRDPRGRNAEKAAGRDDEASSALTAECWGDQAAVKVAAAVVRRKPRREVRVVNSEGGFCMTAKGLAGKGECCQDAIPSTPSRLCGKIQKYVSSTGGRRTDARGETRRVI